ncbi:MAG: DUF4386 domain-containing protein [Bacteroidetes bacterium]|nr:MAG: DUF4386 domain-containing protein [Bacteroidota bacterium]
MNSNRKKTIIAGTLYIIGTIAGILSIAPAIDASDYLLKASANSNQVLIAALFQFIWTIAYAGFAITLYPILRKLMESLATGFLSFRIIAAVLNIIGFIILLLLLSLSQEFVKTGTPDSSYYQTLGDLLRSGRDFMNHIAMILTSCIGSLMFYYLLYQTKLIPHWLSLWGLLGTVFAVFASFLIMFDIIDIITTTYFVLFLPLILLEIVLAIWLIAKGFDSNVMNSITEKE